MFLAEGFEEIEAITPLDILRRAGLEIKTVSITDSLCVEGAHGITLHADTTLSEISEEEGEMFILPGGSLGTQNLGSCEALCDIIRRADKREAYIAAICAAPTILAKMGLLNRRRATCYPSLAGALLENGVKYKNDKVVLDSHFITSEGAGTAADFGFALADKFLSRFDTDKLRLSMVF